MTTAVNPRPAEPRPNVRPPPQNRPAGPRSKSAEDPKPEEVLALLRDAVKAFPRCCDQWQDGLGTLACRECQQITFATMHEVQGILGLTKAGNDVTREEMLRGVALARKRYAAPELAKACQGMVDALESDCSCGHQFICEACANREASIADGRAALKLAGL